MTTFKEFILLKMFILHIVIILFKALNLSILIGSLFLLFLIVYPLCYKRKASLTASDTNLYHSTQDEYKAESDISIGQTSGSIVNEKKELLGMEEKTRDHTSSPRFICEIMITAGPRKKYVTEPDADKDLGEDVCGFVSNGRQVLIWLLDGTSDLYCLRNPLDKKEYFSSRLLAQSIANRIRASFKNIGSKTLNEILLEATHTVKENWQKVINELPEREIEILAENIRNKNIPECATTILVGQLSINGDLSAFRSGDSKMIFYSSYPQENQGCYNPSFAIRNEESNDRLFFRLNVDENGKIGILFNVPKFEVLQYKKVNALIAYSDGVGVETETFLTEKNHTLDQVRNEIFYHFQGTGDDKSICFVEIEEDQ